MDRVCRFPLYFPLSSLVPVSKFPDASTHNFSLFPLGFIPLNLEHAHPFHTLLALIYALSNCCPISLSHSRSLSLDVVRSQFTPSLLTPFSLSFFLRLCLISPLLSLVDYLQIVLYNWCTVVVVSHLCQPLYSRVLFPRHPAQILFTFFQIDCTVPIPESTISASVDLGST